MTVAPCVPHLGSWRAKLRLDFKKRGPVPSCFKKVHSKNTKASYKWVKMQDFSLGAGFTLRRRVHGAHGK